MAKSHRAALDEARSSLVLSTTPQCAGFSGCCRRCSGCPTCHRFDLEQASERGELGIAQASVVLPEQRDGALVGVLRVPGRHDASLRLFDDGGAEATRLCVGHQREGPDTPPLRGRLDSCAVRSPRRTLVDQEVLHRTDQDHGADVAEQGRVYLSAFQGALHQGDHPVGQLAADQMCLGRGPRRLHSGPNAKTARSTLFSV